MTSRITRWPAALVAACVATSGSAQLVISEFRLSGVNGSSDEYIEIGNVSGKDHTVAASAGSGYGIAASDGITRCSIPDGTVIPRNGHFLCVNSAGYSLASYPSGNGLTATGDATYTTGIGVNAGIALFNNNVGGTSYSLANRLDAVGASNEANPLYREGAGYPTIVAFASNFALYRDTCGKQGSVTSTALCPSAGIALDTGDNAADFVYVDTNGISAGAGQRIGAPGPENLGSPTLAPDMREQLLDTCVAAASPPNRVRDFTADPPNNATFGTLDIRRTFINDTGGGVTRLRFRVIDLSVFPASGSDAADLRPRTSNSVTVTVDRPPCGSGTSNVTVQGTTLEQPPSQTSGGGFNSTLSAGTVTLATAISNGASIDLRFLFGVQQTGAFRVGLVVEALPAAGNDRLFRNGFDAGYVEVSGFTG